MMKVEYYPDEVNPELHLIPETGNDWAKLSAFLASIDAVVRSCPNGTAVLELESFRTDRGQPRTS